MNFKKFISGVSALTIAASAFAAMAVTASAADGGSHYGFTWDATNAGANYLKFQTITLNGAAKDNTVQVVNNGSANNAATGTAEAIYNKSAVVEGYVYIDSGALRDGGQDKSVDLQSSTGTSLAKVSMANTGVMNAVTAMGTAQSTITTPGLDTWVYLKAEFDYENELMDLTVGSDKAEDIAIGTNKFGKIIINSGRKNDKTWSNVYFGAVSYTGEYLPATYTLTANPYSKVTVDGNVLYSKADGTVNVASLTLNGGESITVEKNGYTTQNGTVDLTNGNSFTLLPTDPTVSYYEDFAYATTANVGVSTLTIADGILVPDVANNKDAGTFAIPNIDISGKLVTIKIAADSKSDSYVKITLAGVDNAYATYNTTSSDNKWRLTSQGYSNVVAPRTYHNVQFLSGRDGTDAHLFMYVDGKFYNYTQGSVNNRTMSGLSFASSATRGANSIKVNSIKISNKPTEATVTGGDVAGTYIVGSSVTLGESSTGTWTDGTNTYTSGAKYTVSDNVEFTEYITPTDVSSPEEVSFENVDDGVSAKAYKFTVTPGTNAVTSITVTPDETHTLTKAVNLISGEVIFGVIFATSTEGVTLPTLTSSMITVD